MKKILLAGIAAGALAAAGSASALTLSGSYIGGQQVVSNGAVLSAYNIASEAKGPFTGTAAAISNTTGVATVGTGNLLVAALSTGSITSGSYLVTYTATNASFVPTSITAANVGCINAALGTPSTANNCTVAVQSTSASSVTFLVTVNAATFGFEFGAPLSLAAPGAATFTATVALAASPTTTVDNGTATSALIATRSGYSATIGTTAATSFNATIASSFKLFTAAATTATIGSITTAPVASTYKDLAGTVTAAGDITGTTYVVNGTLGTTETISINGVASTAGSTTVAASTAGALTNAPVVLTQTGANAAAQAVLAPSAYTVSVTPTLSGTLNAKAATTVTLGSVTYEGTTILAPWVGDGTNGYQSIVRITNQGSTAIPGVTVILYSPVNATTGTVSSVSGTCSLGAIPANSSVTYSSAQLQTCFGSFGNADALFSVQASYGNLSAKLRIINASTSVVTEQSLGSGQGTTFGVTGTATNSIF